MLGDEWYMPQPLSDKQLDASYPSNVDNHQQLLLLASSSQPNQVSNMGSVPFYNVPSSSSSSSPHMMMIPNFSSLLDSSSSSSNCAPVIEMNDNNNNNNEEFLGVAGGRQLHTPTAPPAMESVMRDFVSPPPYSSSNNTPAILQLLSALNGAGDLSLSPLPGAVAGADYGPAALNFFHGSPAHRVNVGSGASFDTFTHNLGQLAAAGVALDVNGSNGFLNLFGKEGIFGHSNTALAPPPAATTNPYLQLQPLEVYPPMGSPPTLFQKRAAQRRNSAAPANILASPPAKLPTPSSASSKTKPVVSSATNAYHAAMGSPSSIKGNSKLGRNRTEWTKLATGSHAGFNSSSCVVEGAIGDRVRDMEDLVDDVDDQDHFLSETAATIGDHVGHLASELEAAEDDEDCEALFNMSDPDHHMSNMMDGVGGALETSADEQGASQLAATAGSASASVGAEHNGTNDTANRGGGGRGKIKGPPAKNLMAERRRRKKLNDRLYTLRSVVPKISKMDRASILGDAIEYLKELLQRINDLHNELEATAPDNRLGGSLPPTPNSFMNQSSLTPTSTSNLPSFVKLEECPSSSTMQVMTAGPDQTQAPKIEVRTREGRALNIHMFCARRPGLLLSTMRALDDLGLDVQQAVISCFNGFALDVFRAEQSQEDDVAADEIKRVLLLTATSAV